MSFRIRLASMNGFTRHTRGTTVGDVFEMVSMAQRVTTGANAPMQLLNELDSAVGRGASFQSLLESATRSATIGVFRLGMTDLIRMHGDLRIRVTVREENWLMQDGREEFREHYAPHRKNLFWDDYIDYIVPHMEEMGLNGGLVHCSLATLFSSYADARGERHSHNLNISITHD